MLELHVAPGALISFSESRRGCYFKGGEGDGGANSKEKTLISVLLSLSSGNPAIQFLYRYP